MKRTGLILFVILALLAEFRLPTLGGGSGDPRECTLSTLPPFLPPMQRGPGRDVIERDLAAVDQRQEESRPVVAHRSLARRPSPPARLRIHVRPFSPLLPLPPDVPGAPPRAPPVLV